MKQCLYAIISILLVFCLRPLQAQLSWASIPLPEEFRNCYVRELSADNRQHILVFVLNSQDEQVDSITTALLYTTDGGITWRRTGACWCNWMLIQSTPTAILNHQRIMYTPGPQSYSDDGGATWTFSDVKKERYCTLPGLENLTTRIGDNVWQPALCFSQAGVFVSTNNGTNFSLHLLPYRDFLHSGVLAMMNSHSGIHVGIENDDEAVVTPALSRPILSRTNDNWETSESIPIELPDAHPNAWWNHKFSPQKLLYVGDSTFVLLAETNSDATIPNPSKTSPIVWFTTDAGLSWQAVAGLSPASGYELGVPINIAVNSGAVIVITDSNSVIISHNRGETWHNVGKAPPSKVRRITTTSDGYVLIAGNNEIIYAGRLDPNSTAESKTDEFRQNPTELKLKEISYRTFSIDQVDTKALISVLDIIGQTLNVIVPSESGAVVSMHNYSPGIYFIVHGNKYCKVILR